MAVTTIMAAYRLLLEPVAPFTYFGSNISTLDLAAALRLCVVLRQLKDAERTAHVAAHPTEPVEERSFVKDASTTLLVVYGGEALTLPMLGATPSFFYSPTVPAVYTALTGFVESLPSLPPMSMQTELPLSILDGLTRAYLLCQLIPPSVTSLAAPTLAESPWTLLISTLFIANGGFFLVNLTSLLHPAGLRLTTPAELRPLGWTTTDLWCAPLITGLFALLTHAQPAWARAHVLAATWVPALAGAASASGAGAGEKDDVEPVGAEEARAACALLLMGMFVTRTVRTFGAAYVRERAARNDGNGDVYKGKIKTQ